MQYPPHFIFRWHPSVFPFPIIQRLVANLDNEGSVIPSVKFGQLRLRTLALGVVGNRSPATVKVSVAGQPVPATLAVADGKAEITLGIAVVMKEGETLAALII